VTLRYNLWNNTNRTVAYNPETKQPEDTVYQSPDKRIPPQIHY